MRFRKHRSALRIGQIHAGQHNGAWRVEADVDGAPLWFESGDLALRPSAEGFASAMGIPALGSGRDLELADGLCPLWLENEAKRRELLHRWWRYPLSSPPRGYKRLGPAKTRTESTALCFTGGVDSFYNLLSGEVAADYLLFVHGYDIPLADEFRLAEFRRSLDQIAQVMGAEPVVVATNLRTHKAFRKTDWRHAHGGALAAVGHMMLDAAGTLVIPSSFTYDNFHPWGSNWELDPLWSSSRLRVVHADASHRRPEKLARICRSELVRKHLRVCWENHGPAGNCCRCEKCVRTMIGVSLNADLLDFPAFDHSQPLADRIHGLHRVSTDVITAFRHFLLLPSDGTLDPAVRQAITELVARSEQRIEGRIPRLSNTLRRVFLPSTP